MLSWLLYISGFFGLFLINNTVIVMLIYRYDPGLNNPNNLPFLISSVLVGIGMFVCRSLGALTQPLIGYYSDLHWGRWGKRRPFMAIALLPMIVCFILLFAPPINLSVSLTLIYLIAILILFYLAVACYQIPYLAWLPSLAPNSEKQVKLATLMAIASIGGTAISGLAAPWLTQQYGFQVMALIIGIMSLLVLSFPLAISEKFTQASTNQLPFRKSLQFAWQNQVFKSYLIGITSAWIAISIVSVVPTFIAIALLKKNVGFGSLINITALLGIISGFFFVTPMIKHWGKKKTFQVSMVWFAIGLFLLSVYSVKTPQTLLWLSLLLVSYLGLTSFFILPNAMLPDVIAQDTSLQEQKREAIYFGTRGLLIEVGIGLGFLIASILLLLGKTPEQPWGIIVSLLAAIIFALVAAWAFNFYSIPSKSPSANQNVV
jgi:glycoside/pentoside/hexuronide:cation symporter, GPH family